MLRLLPLLALALLPAAIAAPVPPARPPEFGIHGVLTTADLEKVKFASIPVEDKEKSDVKDAEDVVKRVKPAGPPKVRPKNEYDVAVHMPVAKFHAGDIVTAYFVLRNNRDAELALRARLDLCEPRYLVSGGSCEFDIRDRATGKSVVETRAPHIEYSGSLADVPPDGFYCVSGDLNRLAGHALAPGEYEVDWRYRAFKSAPVRFTVRERDGAKPAPPRSRGTLRFYHVQSLGEDDEPPEQPGEPFVWGETELDPLYAPDLAAGLAVNKHGVVVSDIHTVPVADKLVEAWAEWLPYRDGDRVRVTLRAAAPHERVCFAEVPQLYLQLETPPNPSQDQHEREVLRKIAEKLKQSALVTPLTVEVKLPPEWRDECGVTGPARLSVLVTAKPVELPHGRWGKVQRQEEVNEAGRGPDAPPIWTGTVRTDAVEVRFRPNTFAFGPAR